MEEVGVKIIYTEARKWVMNSILLADNTVLIAENESDSQNLVSGFDSVCKRRKLKVNVNKNKVMVYERSRSEVVDFVCPYRVGTECEKECKIILNGEKMEEVNEFKYLGSVMCKHGGTEERQEKERKGIAMKKGGGVFGTNHEWQKCEHGGKEGFEKYNNSTIPHICK